MKFDGNIDAKLGVDGSGAHANAYHHLDSLPAHAPSDAILVQDAQLLFGGDYKRSGVDLILSKDNQELVLHDYFKGEKRAALASSDGAHLSGDVINALTGYQQFAQADGSASVNKVIGHVTKLTGTATAIRNGVSIILNNGDNVEKGDVVQAGSNSTLGLTFIDGTVFGLSSNARMVLNEMVYDPNGSNNSSLMSLVQGTISFVAGETAKHGDMKVETPVATMGIRGTAVLVEIDFVVPGQSGTPNASFRVLVEPDGTTGSYILFDRVTLTPIATVNQAGTETHISNGIVNFNPSAPLSADAQRIINEVFSQRFTDLTNPRGETRFTDSLTPQNLGPVKLADGTTFDPIVQVLQAAAPPPTSGSGPTGTLRDHIAGAPVASAESNSFFERAHFTGNSAIDTTHGLVTFRDVNLGDRPTVSTTFVSFDYQHHGSAALNAQQLANIRAVEVDLVVDPTPGNANNGSATWTYNVPDRAFDFLAAGEVLTLTYEAKVQNNFIGNNEFSLERFTVTITGTNDVPVITTGPQTVGFEGGTSVPGGNLIPDAPTSGTLAFNDVDLTDTHTVTTELTDASMSGPGTATLDMAALEALAPAPMAIFANALSALVATDSTGTGIGRINWTLADLAVFLADFIPDGETLTLTYTVTLTDSAGTTSEQLVTVTITGTDNPAVVWIGTATPGSTSGGLWRNPANWETGTVPKATDDVIIITDQLHGLTPAYPVTIDAPAVARSVTMNDFSLGLLPPHLINQSLLTIGRAFSINADAIVDNSSAGTMSVGGPLTFAGNSVLNNAGSIVLAEGGAFGGQSHITNSGTIEVSAGTLSVSVAIANANGGIAIDSAGVMTLNGATITGGTVTDHGILNLTGSAVLTGGTLTNTHQVNVSGSGNAFDHENVVNTGGDIAILDSASTLTLTNTTITGGTVTDAGTLNLNGTAVLAQGTLTNTHQVNVSGSGNAFNHESVVNTGGDIAILNTSGAALTLTSTTITGGTVTDAGTLNLNGAAVLTQGTLTNTHQVNVSGSGNAFDHENVVNTGGNIAILNTSGATLTLNTASITGGTITDAGTIDSVGGNFLHGVGVTNTGGHIVVEASSTLQIDDGTSITNGTLSIHAGGTLQIEPGAGGGGATLNGVTLDNLGTLQVDVAAIAVNPPANLVLTNGSAITGGVVSVGLTGILDSTAGGNSISGATTITNLGTIESETGTLTISSAGTFTNSGTLEAVNGGTLVLQSETVANGSGTITVGSGSTLNLTDATISGGSLGNANIVHTSGHDTLTNVTVSNSGTIEVQNNTLTITGGSITGGGSIQIDAGALLDLGATVSGATPAAAQTITFNGAGSSTLQIDTASFGGQIAGLGDTDRIDLQTFHYDIHTITATYASNSSNTGGVLTIYDGVHSPIELTLVGDYRGVHFAGSADTDGSTIITMDHDDTAPVFVAGEDAPTASFAERSATTGSTATDPITPIGGTIHFTDVNLVDRPTATIGTQTVTWTQGATNLLLSLTPTEIAAIQNALEAGLSLPTPVPTNTNTGAIGWTYSITDSALDFLGENQTATVTSTILLNDGYSGGDDTATVTVTIYGANDAPTVTTTGAGNSAGTTLPETNAGLTAQGTATLTDVDLTDTATVSVVGVTHTGPTGGLTDSALLGYFSVPGTTFLAGSATSTQFTWSFNSQSQAFDFLATGDTLVLHYTIRPSDGHTALGTGDDVVTITITGTNDAPVISGAGNTIGYTEQAAAVVVDSAIVVSDVDTPTLAGATATISSGFQSGDTLTVNGATSGDIGAIHYAYNSTTHAITLSGTDTLAHYQAALRLVSYGNASNDDPTAGGTAPSRTVTWAVTDGQDPSTTTTTTINVTPVNDAPTLSPVNAQTTDEDTSLVFNAANGNAITLGDVDASGASETVNLLVAHGALTLASTSGLTVTGNGTGAVALTGTVAAINAALNGLSYAPAHDYNGTDLLKISANDLGHTGSGNLSATRQVAITINPVNDAPVAGNDAISNAAPPSGSGWVLDTDNGHYYRYVATFVDWATAASIAASHGNYLATITSAAENSFVAHLPGIGGLPFGAWTGGYTTSADPSGSGPFPDDAAYKWLAGPEAGALVSYTNWNPGQPNGGFFSNVAAIQMAAGGTWYDRPTDFLAGGYVEEWGGQQNQVAFREDTGATLTTAQLLANDTDVDSSHLQVTAVSATSAHGGTVSLNGNIITYHPAADYFGADSFTYTVSDGSLTSSGTVSFNVAPVADAPVLDGNNISVTEGANGVVTLFGIHVTDHDPGSVLSVSATANHGSLAPSGIPGTTEAAVNAQFNTGIVYTPTPPFNDAVPVNDTVTVKITDSQSGLTDSLHFVFQQSGPAGTSLTGTGGKDIIFSTGGNDTLTGLSGSDNFVFSTNFGHDTITDFTPGSDHIDLRAFSATVNATNIETWLAGHTATNAADTVITLDSAQAITLHNVAIGSLHVGDFIVSPHA